jgi:hypothetical protein
MTIINLQTEDDTAEGFFDPLGTAINILSIPSCETILKFGHDDFEHLLHRLRAKTLSKNKRTEEEDEAQELDDDDEDDDKKPG